jgi:hypothetical protein
MESTKRRNVMPKFAITKTATLVRTVVVDAENETHAREIFNRGHVEETNRGPYFSFDKSGLGPGKWVREARLAGENDEVRIAPVDLDKVGRLDIEDFVLCSEAARIGAEIGGELEDEERLIELEEAFGNAADPYEKARLEATLVPLRHKLGYEEAGPAVAEA